MTIKKPNPVESPYVTTDTTPTRLAAKPTAGGGVSTVAGTSTAAAATSTAANTTTSSAGVDYYTTGLEGVAGLANYGRVFAGANVYVTLENQEYKTYNQVFTGNGTVGGANGQIQFNNNGSFAGSANLTFDGANVVVEGIKTDNYLYANGAPFSGGGGNANTGNVTFDNQTIQGTGDEYGGGGLYLAPGPDSVGNLQYFRVRGGDVPTHLHFDSGNNQYFDQIFGDDAKNVQLSNTGDVIINTNDYTGNSAQYYFGVDGTLSLPDNSGAGWPINQQRFGMGNIGAWLDGQWTIGEFSGNGVSGQVGIRIDPAIEGNTGMTFPSQADSVSQPVQIYSTGGGGINFYTGSNNWSFTSTGQTLTPILNTARGDTVSGTIHGFTLNIGDGSQEAIITTPDAVSYNAQRLVINPGKGQDGTGGEGGDIYLWAGRGGNVDGNGGDVKVRGGYGPGNGQGGYIRIEAGDVQGTGTPGYTYLKGGDHNGGTGGYVQLEGGYGGDGNGGYVSIAGGYGVGDGGNVTISGGTSGQGVAHYGNVLVQSGSATWTFDRNGKLTLPNSDTKIGVVDGDGFGTGISTSNAGSYYTELIYNNEQYFWLDGNGVYIGTNWNSGAQQWTFDKSGNLSVPGNIIGAQANVELVAGSATLTLDTTGNLTLPGNTFSVNYANGTPVSLGGGGNTGNVTFNDQVVQGTGDEYGGGGLYLAPSTNSTGNLQYLRVRGGDYPTHIHLDTGNNNYFDQYFGADFRYVKLEANGNILINADDDNGNSATWTFDYNGNLTTPGNISASGNVIATGNANVLTLTTRNGDSNNSYASPQIIMGYAGTADYPSFIHTTHNASTRVDNTIEFWTSDGTQAGTFPANAVLGGSVTQGAFKLAVYANTTVRDSVITSPQPGMMIYVTGTGMQVRGATSWNTIAGSGT